MATFSVHSLFGLDMLEVRFRKLTPAFLNSPWTETSRRAISYYVDYSDGDDGEKVDYEGSFTYTTGDGAILDVAGRVTSYEEFEWQSVSVPFESEWAGFEMSGFDVDLSVLLTKRIPVLFKQIFSGDDTIQGATGYDHLYGFAGNDLLEGWARRDYLDGGRGADTMVGGTGDDTYIVDNAGDVVVEKAGTGGGIDVVRSTVGHQLADSVENLVLLGGARFGYGNGMDNRITGNEGANLLKGGAGSDTVEGGLGDDRIYGNRNADVLSGGEGVDTFFYKSALDSNPTGVDLITDFTRGVDVLHLAGIDAHAGVRGNQKFTFIGAAAFDRADATGQLRFVYDRATDTGTLYGSTDADVAAELVIQLAGVRKLAVDDIVL